VPTKEHDYYAALRVWPAGHDVPQYRAALDPDTVRRGIALLRRLQEELGAACTFFVCGRTLLHALDALEPLAASPLFDIQQHTYSHVVFRDVRYRAEGADAEAALPETPHVALREELRVTDVIRKYLVRDCVGLRTPFGYYRGLRDWPNLLAIVRDTGPRTYSEIPLQFWLDGTWFDVHSYGEGRAFQRALEAAVDEIADGDFVFATAFHEWCAVEADEEGTGLDQGPPPTGTRARRRATPTTGARPRRPRRRPATLRPLRRRSICIPHPNPNRTARAA
jgi:hypothetical protein